MNLNEEIRQIKKMMGLNEQAVSQIISAPQSDPESTPTQSSDSPVSNMGKVLTQLVATGRGVPYEKICEFCKSQDLNSENQRAKAAAQGFANAIDGGENPFSNFGGGEPNQESSAFKAGKAIESNLKNAEDICTMIKYYSNYSGTGEEMVDAISGELNYKVDSTSNLGHMFGEPLWNILNRG